MKQDIKKYTYSDDTGDAQATIYTLGKAIEVIFTSVHMESFDFNQIELKPFQKEIRIRYCKEGRLEQAIDQAFFYLMPSDCLIMYDCFPSNSYQIPLHHYHGITIRLDMEHLEPLLYDYVKLFYDVHPIVKDHIILRKNQKFQRYFEELYQNIENDGLSYLWMKLPELIYLLKHINHQDDEHYVNKSQVELVKDVAQYMKEHLHEKVTMHQLTQSFHVSQTYLQNAFQQVYGMSVIRFVRVMKMQSAAQVLIHTNKTIEQIAEEFGYENESKFSVAFKKLMGDSPGIYRKEHSKIKII